MSHSPNPAAVASASREHRVTVRTLAARKRRGERIAMLTAYDFAFARIFDAAGIDCLLVGDSLGHVVQGHDTTLPVTLDEVVYHTRLVARACRRAMVIGDMPFGSYQVSAEDALRSAIRLVKDGGAQAVKLEGGVAAAAAIERIAAAEIPVMGHVGLTPQAIHRMGGYRVQARTAETARQLHADALALAEAGVGAIVLEGVPREAAAEITAALPIPTIGIGAGPDCDGQILVFHDLVNLTFAPAAKFVRRYADASALFHSAIERYREDVEHRAFPSDAESYHLPESARHAPGAVTDPGFDSTDAIVNRDAIEDWAS